MEVTEVRIKLMDEPGDRLKAFCSVTFDDCFVIRDLKIIEGSTGPFVAMPSRKLTSHCHKCGTKNHLRALYCNQCGIRQQDGRALTDADGRAKLYADIAHPINSACREMVQECVIREFHEEEQRSQEPDYISHYDDYDFDYIEPMPTPSRIDQPHPEASTGKPHIKTPNVNSPSKPCQEPHYRSNSATDQTITADQTESKHDSFGAGIFPNG